MKSRPYYIIYIAVFAVLIWFDRFTKDLVITHMNVGDAIPSQDAFAAIRYTINTGVSFSMFEGHIGGLIAIQGILFVVVAAAFIITYAKVRHPVLQTGLIWICAGGAGNLIDRVIHGYVVDFISVGTFPIWNFADMCVVGGCILLGIFLLILNPKRGKADPAVDTGPEPFDE